MGLEAALEKARAAMTKGKAVAVVAEWRSLLLGSSRLHRKKRGMFRLKIEEGSSRLDLL